jgi:transcriptional regulator with XRE-family HTH domain
MTVSRWERGKAEPSLLHIRRMTMLAKLPAGWFFSPLPEEEAVA